METEVWSLQINKQHKINRRISLRHHGNCRIYPPYPITLGLNMVSKKFYFREPVVSHRIFGGMPIPDVTKSDKQKSQRPGRSRHIAPLKPEKVWQEKFIASLMRHRKSFVSIILHSSKFSGMLRLPLLCDTSTRDLRAVIFLFKFLLQVILTR